MDLSKEDYPKITSGLNYHGDLLAEKVKDLLLRFPGFSLIEEEYCIEEPEAGKIDLVFKQTSKDLNTEVVYVIECKKTYSENIAWIFSKRDKSRYIFPKVRQLVAKDGACNSEIEIPKIMQSCTGYEYDRSKGKNDGAKYLNKDNIDKAVLQLSTYFEGYFRHLKRETKHFRFLKYTFYLVPILITNAPLYLIDFPSENIDLVDAKAEQSDVEQNLEVVDVLTVKTASRLSEYEEEFERPNRETLEDISRHTQTGVFVANASSLETTFNDIYSYLSLQ